MLKLYNSLTRKKEPFKEIRKGSVTIYSCGPTVYDFAHIGNFRAYLCSDLLKRWLLFKGYRVKHVMNLTDVDDKTIRNAREQGVPLDEYTQKYKKAFFEDIRTMRIMPADVFPEATKTIPEMVRLVKALLDKGVAYKAEDSSVYFSIGRFKEYGKLSGMKKDELQTGARVKKDEYSKDAANDFALWKAWDEQDGDVFWETELGKGRPGWHLECSVMSTKNLGKHFDIHTGGVDLIFPHHENEIAQSEAGYGEKFVNYWVHNEWLLADGKKMSKTLGNFHTLRDLLKEGFGPKGIRYLLLTVHYKVQLNFTKKALKAAEAAVERLQEFVDRLLDLQREEGEEEGKGKGKGADIGKLIKKTEEAFAKHMDDDLNIGTAMAAVFDFVKDINKLIDEGKLGKKDADNALSFMKKINAVIDVLGFEKDDKLEPGLELLVKERDKARAAKDWKKADRIRRELRQKGIALMDTPQGTKWKKIKR